MILDEGAEAKIPHPALALGYVPSREYSSVTSRIEDAMRIIARLIAEEGDRYLPIFQRLEQELEIHRAKDKSLQRALDISQGKLKT